MLIVFRHLASSGSRSDFFVPSLPVAFDKAWYDDNSEDDWMVENKQYNQQLHHSHGEMHEVVVHAVIFLAQRWSWQGKSAHLKHQSVEC